MIKVKYEEYWNDNNRAFKSQSFGSLQEVEEWMFEQMAQDYSKGNGMSFPTPEHFPDSIEGPGRIEFTPILYGATIWIHQMETENGIIFSAGKFTAGQRHWSKEVQNWLIHCDQRQKSPKFTFVD